MKVLLDSTSGAVLLDTSDPNKVLAEEGCAECSVSSVRLEATITGSGSDQCNVSFSCYFDATWYAGVDFGTNDLCTGGFTISVLQKTMNTVGCQTCGVWDASCAGCTDDVAASGISGGFTIYGDPAFSMEVGVSGNFNCHCTGTGICDDWYCGTGSAINSGNGGSDTWIVSPCGVHTFYFSDPDFGVTFNVTLTIE